MKYIINMFHLRSYCRSAQNRSLLCLLSSGVRLLRLHLESCIDKSLIYLIRILYHTFVYLSSLFLHLLHLFYISSFLVRFFTFKDISIVPLSGCTYSSIASYLVIFYNLFTDKNLQDTL